jgi:hypothetical protein
MIDSFIFLREPIEKLFNDKHRLHIKSKQLIKLADLELTSSDWTMLSQLQTVLRPFFIATTAMSGHRYPSIGFAFYLLTRLKHFLQGHEKKKVLWLNVLNNYY